MRNSNTRTGALVRAGACVLVMFGVASPAAAQFGGLKKKLKSAAGQESTSEGAKKAGVSDAPAAGNADARGGTVVMTPAVVDQLIAGLKAQEAYREDAKKADTPYGRYLKAQQAYKDAQPKCDQEKQDFMKRLQTDEKLQKQYQAIMDKMSAAMDKGDNKAAQEYQRQAAAMMAPSCLVEAPKQPDNMYEMERDIDAKAEEAGQKSSGLSQAEYAMARERGEGILYDAAKPDVSESEKNAVKAKAKELKPLLGIRDPETERATKPAPEPAAAPTPAPTPPQNPPGMSDDQMDMSRCMAANAQKHEKEIEALGERAKAAQEAGDMPTTMAIADTINQLQMAGCNKKNK